jgi:hypothetical protein
MGMDPFEKIQVGKTGVSVPRLGLGTAPLSRMVLGDGLIDVTAHDEAVKISTGHKNSASRTSIQRLCMAMDGRKLGSASLATQRQIEIHLLSRRR